MRPSIYIFFTAAICLSTFPTAGVAAWSGGDVVIALKPDKDPDAMLAERGELSKVLGEALETKVEVIVPLSAAVIAEGLRNGSVDAAYVSATEAVPIVESGAGVVALANELNGKMSYSSVWLALADSKGTSIEDLKGRPVAFSSRTSTSGYLIPVLDLHERGVIESASDLDTYFGRGNALFGTGYVSAVEMVLNGSADAAAVSDYVFNGDKHLKAEQKAKLRILQTQGPVPSHVIVVSTKLGDADRAVLVAALVGLDAAETSELRDRVFTAKLREVDADEHLLPIKEALRLTGRAQ